MIQFRVFGKKLQVGAGDGKKLHAGSLAPLERVRDFGMMPGDFWGSANRQGACQGQSRFRSVETEGALVFYVFIADGAVLISQIEQAGDDDADAYADGEEGAVGGEGD